MIAKTTGTLTTASSSAVLAQYDSFFQAFWIAPEAGATVRNITFSGTAETFSVVMRDVAAGRPIASFEQTVSSGSATINLATYTANNQSVVMYLFGKLEEATEFAEAIAEGWTEAEQEILADPDLLHMIPDVDFEPQLEVRAARSACDPEDPESVELMNAELDLIYAGFTEYDGEVIPGVRDGLKGILVAAPGDPPEWVPP